MNESSNIACTPYVQEEREQRVSRNFETCGIPNEGQLIWYIITKDGHNPDICVDIKQVGSQSKDILRFENLKDGTVTPFGMYRNLYVANPREAKGHFVVRVEAYN